MRVLLLFFLFVNLYADRVQMVQRVMEDRIYNKLNEVNRIQFFINQYILSTAKIPASSTDLTGFDSPMKAFISTTTWPKDVNTNSQDITFVVDKDNFVVVYDKFFTTEPSEDILDLLRYNVSFPHNAFIDRDKKIVIPLKSEVMAFLIDLEKLLKLQNDTVDTYGYQSILIDYDDLTPSCSGISPLSGKTWYKPDGAGGFSVQYCDQSWIYVPMHSTKQFVNAASFIAPFNNNKVYYINSDNNGTEAIYIGLQNKKDIE